MRNIVRTRVFLVSGALALGGLWSAARADGDAFSACDSAGSVCCQMPVCNRVYIIRGAAGWWPAMHTMLARLRRHGYEPDVYLFSGVNHAVDNLVARRRRGEEVGPVRIIGYSLGGHGAANMAAQLYERGVIVDRLLLVECFSNTTITPNVRRCFNLYETRWSDEWNIFRGTPVERACCRTQLVNINVAEDPNWRRQKSRNHFTMADDTRVQQTLVHLLSCDCLWRIRLSGCDGPGCIDTGCDGLWSGPPGGADFGGNEPSDFDAMSFNQSAGRPFTSDRRAK